MRIFKLIFCSLFFGTCNLPLHADDTQSVSWSTDVIGINEAHLSADYWLNQLEDAGQILKSPDEIAEFNRAIFSDDQHMVDLTQLPSQLSGVDVRKKIQAISKPNKSALYKPTGKS